jgi:hypothetical protein
VAGSGNSSLNNDINAGNQGNTNVDVQDNRKSHYESKALAWGTHMSAYATAIAQCGGGKAKNSSLGIGFIASGGHGSSEVGVPGVAFPKGKSFDGYRAIKDPVEKGNYLAGMSNLERQKTMCIDLSIQAADADREVVKTVEAGKVATAVQIAQINASRDVALTAIGHACGASPVQCDNILNAFIRNMNGSVSEPKLAALPGATTKIIVPAGFELHK